MVLSHRGRLTVNPSGGLRGAATSEETRSLSVAGLSACTAVGGGLTQSQTCFTYKSLLQNKRPIYSIRPNTKKAQTKTEPKPSRSSTIKNPSSLNLSIYSSPKPCFSQSFVAASQVPLP
jgi:hypothetical protein